MIVGSSNSVTATSPQTLGAQTYAFASWSDGGAQSHQIVAPATNTTYTATYSSSGGVSFTPTADANVRSNQGNKNFGTQSLLRLRLNQSRVYLKFTVTGLSAAPTSAVLRLWVTDGGANGGSVYKLANTTWTETGITWNNAPAISGTALSSVGTATTGTWVRVQSRLRDHRQRHVHVRDLERGQRRGRLCEPRDHQRPGAGDHAVAPRTARGWSPPGTSPILAGRADIAQR